MANKEGEAHFKLLIRRNMYPPNTSFYLNYWALGPFHTSNLFTADLIKMAMIHVDSELEKRNLNARMILQVHDELVFEVHEDHIRVFTSIIKKVMCAVLKLRVPLEVEVGCGQNWEEAH